MAEPAGAGSLGVTGISRAEDLLRRVAADRRPDLVVGILGPGGCRKTALLHHLAHLLAADGSPVLDARTLGPADPPAGAIVLADDAHAMTPAVLQRLTDLVDAGTARVLVAFRPWPRPPALTTLAARLRERGPLTVLHHLAPDELSRRAAALIGGPVPADLLAALADQTCGLPLLLDEVMGGLAGGGPHRTPGAGQLDFRRVDHLDAHLVDGLRFVVDDLEPAPRRLMHAVAAGAGLETRLLAALFGEERARIREWVEQSRATGYLLGDGRLIPVFRGVLLATEPADHTRELQLELLDIHAASGADGAGAVGVARALATGGTRDARVAGILTAAARRHLPDNPAAAAVLYAEGRLAGANGGEVAAEHAEAAALSGKLDLALQLVDPQLADPATDGATRAATVAATVLARQGHRARAAELYDWLGPQRIGAAAPLAAMTALVMGRPDDADALLDAAPLQPRLTMLDAVTSQLVEGLRLSLADASTEALAVLTRAATMLEPLGPALLPDTPTAVAALICINVGELDFADGMLRRALSQRGRGDRDRSRHLLLLAWLAMARGRPADARTVIDQVTADSVLDPRDELLLAALQVGIGRRAGDAAALTAAWRAARHVVARQDVDLFTITALSEVALGAHRLGQQQWIADHITRSWDLLAAVGDPLAWSTPLHWACGRIAVADGRAEQTRRHVAALRAPSGVGPHPAVLADALTRWLTLDRPDRCDDVRRSAEGLHRAGLSWDAAQLLSAAADRCDDRRTGAGLLQAARAMAVPDAGGAGVDVVEHNGRNRYSDGSAAGHRDRIGAAPAPRGRPAGLSGDVGAAAGDDAGGRLSAREVEIARLLLRSLTYSQIGEKLFISPKTVEHHVARMKQRLGVSRRSELFDALRALTGSPEGALR
jgi:DNA-binding CsgD family transcriptional regulator